MIKKIYFFLLLCGSLLVSPAVIFSQPGIGIPYSFTTTSPNTAPAGGTYQTVFTSQTNQISGVYTAASAGMTGYPGFTFGGTLYTGFYVSTSGWVGLTNGAATFTGASTTNSLATCPAQNPIIAPLWDSLTASVAYQWIPVSNELWVRWVSVKWNAGNLTNTLFYLRLTVTTGKIDLIFTGTPYTPVNNPSASIGIAGPCAGDYYSVKSTFAAVDNNIENIIVTKPTGGGAGINFTFQPAAPANDNCAGAISLGTVSAICSPDTFATVHATPSSAGFNPCSPTGLDQNDVWFYFIKPAGVTDIRVTTTPTTCHAVPGTSVQVYSGTCAVINTLNCASTSTGNPNFGEVDVTGRSFCNAETLYARVTSYNDVAGKFKICVTDITPVTGSTCSNATPICSLPYSRTGLTTVGFVNDYDSINASCHTVYMNGEDYLFSYTPTVNQCIQLTLTNTGPVPGIFVTDGCPDLPSTNCIASFESASNVAIINSVSLVAGTTYYFIVDNSSVGGGIAFDIDIAQIGTTQPNDVCALFTNLGNITSGQVCTWSGNYSTECATPSPAFYPDPGCAGFLQGTGANSITGDVWFRFTSQLLGNINIDTRLGSANSMIDGGMAIYTGNCISLTLLACDDNSGTGPSMPGLTIPASVGTQYYIRIWSANPTNTGTFQLCISANCFVPNDLPCNAVAVTLGTPAIGNNFCAGASNEPPAPACWVNGTVNTVWYSAVVPPSGKLNIKTGLISNTNTQIAAYKFNTGCANAASSYSLLGCNDNTAGCPCGNADLGSELKLTGLAPGSTVYIAIDGNQGITGQFFITVIDGNNPYPPLYSQDCPAAISICSNATINVPYASTGVGNFCDQNGNLSGCFSCGERSGLWYTFTVNPPSLQFTMTPNTYSPVPNFDFAIWNVTGQTNPCQYIATGIPVRCNNNGASGVGATGLRASLGAGFSAPITVTGPTTFVMAIRNWNHTPVGYTIDWMGTDIVPPGNPTMTWQGTADTTFENGSNWGCFSSFSCAKDVVIPFTPTVLNQPTINANDSVHNLTVFAGASLRIKSGKTLSVCGNLSVYGTLITETGSTIVFSGGEAQTINGVLTSTNAFTNLSVNKSTNSVVTNVNVDARGNFTTMGLGSIFNVNGKYMKVAGNFTNFFGSTTYTGIGGSTLEFNGAANQNFTNQNNSLLLNRVVMNKSGGKLYLTGANSTMNIDTELVLTSGHIVTRSISALEVNVKYNLTGAISGYSPSSFIDGKLRRKVYAGAPLGMPFSIDYPVGDSIKGYQLANVSFLTSTVIPDLQGCFYRWSGPPPASGPVASECITATYSTYPIFDNGYWTFLRPNNLNFNGMYRISLYNNNVTNNSGMGWTVASADTTLNPNNPASWGLIGKCVPSSTPVLTQRDSINSPPATLAMSFNRNFVTVQTGTPLPIELFSFTAESSGEGVICKWITATEINNAYFDVQRSLDGVNFEDIGRVNGYGAGISSGNRSYSFYDDNPCEGIRYYRLRQVDIDGHFTFTNSVAIKCTRSPGELIIYPNPARSEITLSFYEFRQRQMKIIFSDYTGRLVKEELISSQKGFNTLHFPVSDLADGMYFLRMEATDVNSMGEPVRQVRFMKN